MVESKVRKRIADLVTAMDTALERWYAALESDAGALLPTSFESQLHALRGWDEARADGYAWALEFVEVPA
jgi:hypothetical protein